MVRLRCEACTLPRIASCACPPRPLVRHPMARPFSSPLHRLFITSASPLHHLLITSVSPRPMARPSSRSRPAGSGWPSRPCRLSSSPRQGEASRPLFCASLTRLRPHPVSRRYSRNRIGSAPSACCAASSRLADGRCSRRYRSASSSTSRSSFTRPRASCGRCCYTSGRPFSCTIARASPSASRATARPTSSTS